MGFLGKIFEKIENYGNGPNDLTLSNSPVILIVKQLPKPHNEEEYIQKILKSAGINQTGRISTFYTKSGNLSNINDQMTIAAEFGRCNKISIDIGKINRRVIEDAFYGKVLILDIVPNTPQVKSGEPSAKLTDSYSCDVCGLRINLVDGYFLTTRQVVTTKDYWNYLYTHQGSHLLKEDPKSTRLPLITAQIAGQVKPWLVCESCSKMFTFDRSLAKKCAITQTAPPGSGPVEIAEAGLPAIEVRINLDGKKRKRTAFEDSKNALNNWRIKDIEWKINNDPYNSENYKQFEEFLLINGFWFEAKKSLENRYKNINATSVELKNILGFFKKDYCKFYEQCLKDRQPFCTKCHTELKYIGNISDEVSTKIISECNEIREKQKLSDTWQGIVCTKCQIVYCFECIENKSNVCPECGNDMYPANLYYLTKNRNISRVTVIDGPSPIAYTCPMCRGKNIEVEMKAMEEFLPDEHFICPNCGWSTKQGFQDFLINAKKSGSSIHYH
jgi:hypothetical protein